MICKKCGKQINNGAKFCENCGTRIEYNQFFGVNSKKIGRSYKGLLYVICIFLVVIIILCISGKFMSENNDQNEEVVKSISSTEEYANITDEIITNENIEEKESLTNEEVNEYLSTIVGNKLFQYSEDDVKEREILWFVMNVFESSRYDEILIEGDYENYVLEEEKVNEVLEYYFNVSAPIGNYEDVWYEDGKYHYAIYDMGEIGRTVAITDQQELLNNGNYKITFNTYYVWPENFENGSVNPVQNFEEYYGYSLEDIEKDSFCEKEGIGEAEVCIQNDRIIVLKLNVDNSVREFSEGDYVELKGTLKEREDGNVVVAFEQPLIFHGLVETFEIEEVGLTGQNDIDFNKILGRNVIIYGQAMEAHTRYHYSPVMIMEGYTSLVVDETICEENMVQEEKYLLCKSTYYNKAGEIDRSDEYEYDEKNMLIKSTQYNSKGEMVTNCKYSYTTDLRDNLKKIENCYDNMGNLYYWNEYEHDEYGNEICVRHYDKDGEVLYWVEYEYDDYGNKIRGIRKLNSGTEIDFVYEYDELGRCNKLSVHNIYGEITRWTEYEFDEEGNVTNEYSYEADGTLYEMKENEYIQVD